MKVLFLTHYSGLGGASQALLTLMDGLKKYDVKPYVILPNNEGELQQELEKRGIEYTLLPFWAGVVNVQFTHTALFPLKCVVNLLRQIYTAIRAVHYVHKWKIDIIHANSTYVIYGMILGILTGKPNIWHLREEIKGQFNSVFFHSDYTMKILAGYADCIIAVSGFIKETYQECLDKNQKKICTIYDGTRVYAQKKEYTRHRPVRLLYLGGKNVSKGWPELYLLYQGMKKKGFEDYMIYMPSFKKEYMKEYAEKEGWDSQFWDHIILEKPMGRKEVDEFRTEMDIFIQPSYAEAFGLVTTESMLIGLPVVAVDSGANLELIEDKESGILYQRGNALDMAEKVIRMMEDDELREKIVANARKKAEKYYTPEANARAISHIYKDILRQ